MTSAELNNFTVDWYTEDPSRLGHPIPQPRIKQVKDGGHGKKLLLLSWNPGCGTWVDEEEVQESVFTMDQVEIPESSCNTRKDVKTLLRR